MGDHVDDGLLPHRPLDTFAHKVCIGIDSISNESRGISCNNGKKETGFFDEIMDKAEARSKNRSTENGVLWEDSQSLGRYCTA